MSKVLVSVFGRWSCVWVWNMVSRFATKCRLKMLLRKVPNGAPTLGGGNMRMWTFQLSQRYNWSPILLGSGATSLGVWCVWCPTFWDSLVLLSSSVACLVKKEDSTLENETTTLSRKVGRQLPSDGAPCPGRRDTPTNTWLGRASSLVFLTICWYYEMARTGGYVWGG
jgi:hypothetical protein